MIERLAHRAQRRRAGQRHDRVPSVAEWAGRTVWVPPAPTGHLTNPSLHGRSHAHDGLPTVAEWTGRTVAAAPPPGGDR